MPKMTPERGTIPTQVTDIPGFFANNKKLGEEVQRLFNFSVFLCPYCQFIHFRMTSGPIFVEAHLNDAEAEALVNAIQSPDTVRNIRPMSEKD